MGINSLDLIETNPISKMKKHVLELIIQGLKTINPGKTHKTRRSTPLKSRIKKLSRTFREPTSKLMKNTLGPMKHSTESSLKPSFNPLKSRIKNLSTKFKEPASKLMKNAVGPVKHGLESA